jgi:hypothetical protein
MYILYLASSPASAVAFGRPAIRLPVNHDCSPGLATAISPDHMTRQSLNAPLFPASAARVHDTVGYGREHRLGKYSFYGRGLRWPGVSIEAAGRQIDAVIRTVYLPGRIKAGIDD